MSSGKWREVTAGLESQDETQILQALDKLKLVEKHLSKEPTNKLLPPCIGRLQHHNVAIRAAAMATIAKQLRLENNTMGPMVDEICKRMSSPNMTDLKVDRDGGEKYIELHTNICATITSLQSRYPKKLMPHYKPLGNYLVDCMQADRREVAGAACEYWAKLQVPPVPARYMDAWVPVVLTKLQKIIPGLLNCMMYHADLVQFKLDVVPQTARRPADTPSWIETLSNVRNYAALGFENLCKIFHTEVIAIFKPYLQRYLASDNWLQVEGSILALGAFTQALGTPKDMKDLYPDIMPALIDKYSHPEPLVRSITCFTMQQFINFNMKGVKDPLPKVIKCTIALLDDELYETRVMALRSIAMVLAYSEKDITAHNGKIADALVRASTGMKGEALYSYYDCVGHLFGRSGDILEDQTVTALMEPLMKHWRGIDVTSYSDVGLEDLIQVCQPLSLIASYSRAAFSRYNEAIFEKIASHIEGILKQSKTLSLNDPTLNGQLVAMIDVGSAIFEGQGPEVGELARKYKFERLALDILREGDFGDKTHQSILALLGHLCMHNYSTVEPHLNDYLEVCETKLNSSSDSVKNNTLWTLAGLAKGCREKNDKFLSMVDRFADILKSADSDQGQATNAALVITNLGKKWPQDIIATIARDDIFIVFCTLLQMQFQRDLEKVTIFYNLCDILEKYMKKIPKEMWAPFCTAIALCDCNDDALLKMLTEFLRKLRTALGNKGWNMVSNQIGPQLAVTLRKKYKLY